MFEEMILDIKLWYISDFYQCFIKLFLVILKKLIKGIKEDGYRSFTKKKKYKRPAQFESPLDWGDMEGKKLVWTYDLRLHNKRAYTELSWSFFRKKRRILTNLTHIFYLIKVDKDMSTFFRLISNWSVGGTSCWGWWEDTNVSPCCENPKTKMMKNVRIGIKDFIVWFSMKLNTETDKMM